MLMQIEQQASRSQGTPSAPVRSSGAPFHLSSDDEWNEQLADPARLEVEGSMANVLPSGSLNHATLPPSSLWIRRRGHPSCGFVARSVAVG
jgi:hypothetical protein